MGRVRRIGRSRAAQIGRVLKGFKDGGGYLCVTLSAQTRGEVHAYKVATLVLNTFVGPPPTPKHEGAHDNGVREDNRLSNLFWKTSKENKADKIRHGTNGISLNSEKVFDIRRRRKSGETYQSIADALAVSKSAVAHVVKGRCWSAL
jgi:hypothetical protein